MADQVGVAGLVAVLVTAGLGAALGRWRGWSVWAPEPLLAKAVYSQPRPKGVELVWWPLWAGIARSGDLGFTTGPYTADGRPGGYYFTVWAKQPDGSWKWLFDGGPPSDQTGAAPQGSDVAYARPAARQAGSSAKAMELVQRSANRRFYGPFAEWVGGDDAPVRARLAAALIKGMAVTREVTGGFGMDGEQCEHMADRMAVLLQELIDGDAPAEPAEAALSSGA